MRYKSGRLNFSTIALYEIIIFVTLLQISLGLTQSEINNWIRNQKVMFINCFASIVQTVWLQ